MKQLALSEPKPFRAFRDKYLAAIMMVAALFITSIVSAQTDSAKYSPINGHGFKYKRHAQDSVAMMPLSTSPHTPYRKGGYRFNLTDSCLQLWTGTQWIKDIRAHQLTDSSFKIGDSTITIRGTGGGGTSGITELSGDVIAGPGPGTQTSTISSNAVTDDKLRTSAGLSLIGRSTNSTGNVADISAGTDNQVFRRNGTSIGFGAINIASSNAVTGLLSLSNGGTGSSNGLSFPQTLTTGRTFSDNDSAIITNKSFKFKGGTVSSDTLDIIKSIRIGTSQPIDSRLKMIVKDGSADTTSFSAIELKTTNDNEDLNVDGATIVKHDKNYLLTPGYASTLQVYSLARSAGTIIGNNNFVGATIPYVPGEAEISNGFIRFELGPLWPRSEKMRINNRGEVIFGWTTLRTYLASQSGTTVTDPVNTFSSTDVGKFFCWGDRELGGTASFADRITGYSDAHHITVETNRTIAAQGGRVCIPNAIIDTLGNALYRYVRLDSVKFSTGDETSFFKLKSLLDTFRIVREGTPTDAVFDVTSGITTVRLPADIYINGSTYSTLHFNDQTHSFGDITATSSATTLTTLDDLPINFNPDNAPSATITSTKFQSFKPTIISGIADVPIAKLDVRNPDGAISAYIENSRGSGNNFGVIIDVTASATENRALYATANNGATNKAIMIPSSSASTDNDYAISSEVDAKSYFRGRVGINTTTPAWGLDIQRTAGGNKDSINLQSTTGARQMLVMDTATGKFQRMEIPSSGSWSPTLTADVNVDGTPTALHATYNRVGNIVTCYVTVSVDPTANTTQTEVGITLPIASNFTDSNDLSGAGAGSTGNGKAVFVQFNANTGSDRATLIFESASTSASIVTGSFQYTVL